LLSLVESSRELPAWGSRGHSIERVVPFSRGQLRKLAYLYRRRRASPVNAFSSPALPFTRPVDRVFLRLIYFRRWRTIGSSVIGIDKFRVGRWVFVVRRTTGQLIAAPLPFPCASTTSSTLVVPRRRNGTGTHLVRGDCTGTM